MRPLTSPLDATAVRSVASFVAVVPFAIVGVIALVFVILYNLPASKERRARAMAADSLVIEANEMPEFPAAQSFGECKYSARSETHRLYQCTYLTTADFESLRQFYGAQFGTRGWTASNPYVLASHLFASWCKNGQSATIEYSQNFYSSGWNHYALAFSVGLPPEPCGV